MTISVGSLELARAGRDYESRNMPHVKKRRLSPPFNANNSIGHTHPMTTCVEGYKQQSLRPHSRGGDWKDSSLEIDDEDDSTEEGELPEEEDFDTNDQNMSNSHDSNHRSHPSNEMYTSIAHSSSKSFSPREHHHSPNKHDHPQQYNKSNSIRNYTNGNSHEYMHPKNSPSAHDQHHHHHHTYSNSHHSHRNYHSPSHMSNHTSSRPHYDDRRQNANHHNHTNNNTETDYNHHQYSNHSHNYNHNNNGHRSQYHHHSHKTEYYHHQEQPQRDLNNNNPNPTQQVIKKEGTEASQNDHIDNPNDITQNLQDDTNDHISEILNSLQSGSYRLTQGIHDTNNNNNNNNDDIPVHPLLMDQIQYKYAMNIISTQEYDSWIAEYNTIQQHDKVTQAESLKLLYHQSMVENEEQQEVLSSNEEELKSDSHFTVDAILMHHGDLTQGSVDLNKNYASIEIISAPTTTPSTTTTTNHGLGPIVSESPHSAHAYDDIRHDTKNNNETIRTTHLTQTTATTKGPLKISFKVPKDHNNVVRKGIDYQPPNDDSDSETSDDNSSDDDEEVNRVPEPKNNVNVNVSSSRRIIQLSPEQKRLLKELGMDSSSDDDSSSSSDSEEEDNDEVDVKSISNTPSKTKIRISHKLHDQNTTSKREIRINTNHSESSSSSSSESDSDNNSIGSDTHHNSAVTIKTPKPSVGKLKVRGKIMSQKSTLRRKLEKQSIANTKVSPSSSNQIAIANTRPLTSAEVFAIMAQDDVCLNDSCNNNWVRRSMRQPSRSAMTAPHVVSFVNKMQNNDPDMVVLKCKKFLPDPDTPCVIIDAMLDALAKNTNCQALYIQNFNEGMRDEQVLHLLQILQSPSCKIWCLNIGETYKVKRKTWAIFTNGLKKTKITHMYASEHTISGAMKEQIRETIRKNRSKHDLHINPMNLDVIVQCTHCWWNPINAKVLQPYLKQGGYDHLLNDRVAQGTKDVKTDASNI